MSDSSPAPGSSSGRPPQPTPLPAGGPRHTRSGAGAPDPAGDTAQFPVQRPAGGGGAAYQQQQPSVLQQRLQGVFLTIIGLAGIVGGVFFSIEAPRFTPVPVVFLTFWLVMVIVGRILFTGLGKLRDTGVGAPAPEQVRAVAAVAAIVMAVGLMGLAATGPGAGVASAAPCPGGGPATCGPDPNAPTLTFTPPPAQTGAQGGQQGQQGGQNQQGIATSPQSGGDNGPGIQAQTPQFGTPGQQAPNISGNEQPGQQQGGGQQQRGNGQQGQQNQSPVRTTAPGGPQESNQQQQQPGQSNTGQPSSPTVTVTETQSQCPAPGPAGAPGAAGPGGGNAGPGNEGGNGNGSDNGGSDDEGAPSWSYLVAEAAGVMAGRRRTAGSPPSTADDSTTTPVSESFLEDTHTGSNDYPKATAWGLTGGRGPDGREITSTKLGNGQEAISGEGPGVQVVGNPDPGTKPFVPSQGPNQQSTVDQGDGTTNVTTTDSNGTPSTVNIPNKTADEILAEQVRQQEENAARAAKAASRGRSSPPDSSKVDSPDVDWSWGKSDTAGTTASAPMDVISELLRDAQKQAPSLSAAERGIGYGSKLFGPAAGLIIGSASDINQGMTPGRAIGTNAIGAAAGAGAGWAAGAAAGAAIGSAVPGFGTAIGLVVGAGAGLLATKFAQSRWR